MNKIFATIVVTLLTLCLCDYQAVAAAKRAQGASRVVPTIVETHHDNPNSPCRVGDDNRASDLCAQWKAADAARDSLIVAQQALADQRSATMVAWCVGVGSLFGIGATTYFAWHSLRVAKKTANYAADTLKSERAWITPQFPKLEWEGNLGSDRLPFRGSPGVRIKWENTGRSPAVDVRYAITSYFQSKGQPAPTFADFSDFLEIPALGVGACVTPNGPKINADDLKHFIDGKLDLYVYSRVEYRDLYTNDQVRVSEVSFQLAPHFTVISGIGHLSTSGKTFRGRNQIT